MKKPSLLLTLSAIHAFIWSGGAFAVLQFLGSSSGGHGFGALVIWGATIACFFALVGVHLFVARLVQRNIGATPSKELED